MASRRYHLNDVAMREARAQERGIGHGQPGGAWLLIWNRLVMGAIRDSVAAERRTTRPCSSCGAPRGCAWSVDAWVCRLCGDEWYPEHNPVRYAPPSEAR